jgi:hypothetical protein
VIPFSRQLCSKNPNLPAKTTLKVSVLVVVEVVVVEVPLLVEV